MDTQEPIQDFDDLGPTDMVEYELAALRTVLSQRTANVKSISESAFKSRFLPVLMAKGTKVDARYWLEISGHPQKPFDVTDDVTGEVIFRVPALLKSGNLPKRDSRALPLGEVAARYETIRRVSPKEAEMMLNNEISRRTTSINNQNIFDDSESDRQWAFIIDRYGIVFNGTVKSPGAAGTPTVDPNASLLSEDADDI